MIEAMSGITTECAGTFLHEFPAHLGGQALQPHQAAVIDDVAGRYFGRGARLSAGQAKPSRAAITRAVCSRCSSEASAS